MTDKTVITITGVSAIECIDCKSRPIVEVNVTTSNGKSAKGAAPTGTTVGNHEPFVLRDGGERYGGLGVSKAVKNVNDIIAPALIGMNVHDQKAIDTKMQELDGTEDMSKLGGNAIGSVSIAVKRAAAAALGIALYEYMAGGAVIKTVPVPCANVINGVRSGGRIDYCNEYLLVPHGAEEIDEAVQMIVEVYNKLDHVLEEFLGKKPEIGGSQGYKAPPGEPKVVFNLMQNAVDQCGYKGRMSFATDIAANDIYRQETDDYPWYDQTRVKRDFLVDYLKELTESFDILFIEDPFHDNDWEGHVQAVKEVTRTNIVADDLTASNTTRLALAQKHGAASGFVLKPNQAGTMTRTEEAVIAARKAGLFFVPSGRSGGVVGDVMMDVSVGFQAPFQKNGAPRSGERIEKLNFLKWVGKTHGCALSNISSYIRF